MMVVLICRDVYSAKGFVTSSATVTNYSSVAQLVEHAAVNRVVSGSSPDGGANAIVAQLGQSGALVRRGSGVQIYPGGSISCTITPCESVVVAKSPKMKTCFGSRLIGIAATAEGHTTGNTIVVRKVVASKSGTSATSVETAIGSS
jgi:hypothetical protein